MGFDLQNSKNIVEYAIYIFSYHNFTRFNSYNCIIHRTHSLHKQTLNFRFFYRMDSNCRYKRPRISKRKVTEKLETWRESERVVWGK